MHYYKFNVKDWTRDTAHLTVVEEGIYRRLLDHYYESEKPIPTETQSVIRRLRLGGYEVEVKAILDEFFQLSDNGYCHARCDDEIAKYHAKADANRGNGKLGGRPLKPKNNPDGFEKEPTDNLNHKPLTTNQEEDLSSADDLRKKAGLSLVVDIYHECLPDLPAVRMMTKKRHATLAARQREYPKANDADWWSSFFLRASESSFLMGTSSNARSWRADFDFLLSPKGFIGIIEGKYE